MNILVINSGSSSIKFQFINTEQRKALCKGLLERIGETEGTFNYQTEGQEKTKEVTSIPTHRHGIQILLERLTDAEQGVIQSLEDIDAVGHRIVHGGETIKDSVLLNEEYLQIVKDCIKLAPLHNPANLMGVEALESLLTQTPQVGVFDTAFHATMPKKAYIYPLDYSYYEQHGIRRFGFHGTSHEYVSIRAAEILGKKLEDFNCITCHLGNGASLTAVKGGCSVDTTMGFTPVCGVPMGTRTGDIDPAIILHLIDEVGMTTKEVHELIYKQSGLKGMSAISNDMRDIKAQAFAGSERAQMTMDVFAHCTRKYIAALATTLEGRLDAVIFTAGMGENEWEVREMICEGLEILGIHLDKEQNKVRGQEKIVSTEDSAVKVMIVPTNEELMIALETERIIKARGIK